MVFTEMTVTESRVNFLLFVFLLGIVLTTFGLSGIVNFRLRQARHHLPRYRGRRRAQPVVVAFVLRLARRYDFGAGDRRTAATVPPNWSTSDDRERIKVPA